MMRALYTAATGMLAEQTNVDAIAHNLSNVNTTGYKAERVEFKSLLYQTIQTRTTTANGEQKPVGAQVGLGTRVAATMSTYTQGSLTNTEIKTDFAIDGEGFFAVRGIDGQRYYTRSGNFTWSMDGAGNTILTDAEGCPVLDRDDNVIMVPQRAEDGELEYTSDGMVFRDDGAIFYQNPETKEVIDLEQNIALYQFNNPAGLEKVASSRLVETAASGNPLQEGTTPGIKQSKVRQCWLEASNVQVADEMVNMIIAQRAYELNSKAIQTADSMLDTANNLKR